VFDVAVILVKRIVRNLKKKSTNELLLFVGTQENKYKKNIRRKQRKKK